jgi:hypothetical protein
MGAELPMTIEPPEAETQAGDTGGVPLSFAIALPRVRPDLRKRRPRRLGRGVARALRGIAEVVAPSRDLGFDPGAAAVEFIEGYLPYLPPLLGRLFPLGVMFLEWSPILFVGRLSRASGLSRAERRRHFEAVSRARLELPRVIWRAVRGLTGCAIYRRPEVHRAIGYAPQAFVDEMVRLRREKFGAPEPW